LNPPNQIKFIIWRWGAYGIRVVVSVGRHYVLLYPPHSGKIIVWHFPPIPSPCGRQGGGRWEEKEEGGGGIRLPGHHHHHHHPTFPRTAFALVLVILGSLRMELGMNKRKEDSFSLSTVVVLAVVIVVVVVVVVVMIVVVVVIVIRTPQHHLHQHSEQLLDKQWQ